jgi:hypothetical protein
VFNKIMAVIALTFGLMAVGVGTPAYAAKTGDHCTQYVWPATGKDICKEYPGSRDRGCKDIRPKFVLLKDDKAPYYDPWRLNADGDRYGCEPSGYPPNPKPTCPTVKADYGIAGTKPKPCETKPTTPPTTAPTTAPTTTPTTVPTTPPVTTPPTTEPTTVPPTDGSTATATVPPTTDEPQLPLTGPGTLLSIAGALLALGVLAGVLSYRRKTKFQA